MHTFYWPSDEDYYNDIDPEIGRGAETPDLALTPSPDVDCHDPANAFDEPPDFDYDAEVTR